MEYCREEPKLEVESQTGKWPDGGNSEASIDEEAKEKRLIRKIDIYVLPFVVLLYLFSFLDRGTLRCRVILGLCLTIRSEHWKCPTIRTRGGSRLGRESVSGGSIYHVHHILRMLSCLNCPLLELSRANRK